MRISLVNGNNRYALAGDTSLSERQHSSAGDFRMNPSLAEQISQRIRASYAQHFDRGNIETLLSFSTSRLFSSVALAELWCMDYETAFPRTGTLLLDAIAANGTITRRTLENALVSPPARQAKGCTVLLDYQVKGGAVAPAPIINVTGTLTADGTTPVVFPAMVYSGNANGRPYYSSSGDTGIQPYYVQWAADNSGWYLICASPAAIWTSASNVATPNLATGWTPGGSATGTPTLTAV